MKINDIKSFKNMYSCDSANLWIFLIAAHTLKMRHKLPPMDFCICLLGYCPSDREVQCGTDSAIGVGRGEPCPLAAKFFHFDN